MFRQTAGLGASAEFGELEIKDLNTYCVNKYKLQCVYQRSVQYHKPVKPSETCPFTQNGLHVKDFSVLPRIEKGHGAA